MDKEKEERHVVLKGGSLMDDGRQGDAQATLKITRSLNKDSGKINLNVELVSSRMLGICGVTLMKPDSTPVMGKIGAGAILPVPAVPSPGNGITGWNRKKRGRYRSW